MDEQNNKETRTFVSDKEEYSNFTILCEYMGFEYSGKIRSLIRKFLSDHKTELREAKKRLKKNV